MKQLQGVQPEVCVPWETPHHTRHKTHDTRHTTHDTRHDSTQDTTEGTVGARHKGRGTAAAGPAAAALTHSPEPSSCIPRTPSSPHPPPSRCPC